ncbi:Protein-tyrosine phosphatase [Necator americanus]|uniref:Protein-tyrosine phosphatase n=1 Tax=Necator americanus TaxID=51031 RepID=W2TAV4_NECAM|nr:Protein-tyrosine phosphatase [Necator americanus]ETN78988.1 Protein-tyrosine phosphatase [Necator americanus]
MKRSNDPSKMTEFVSQIPHGKNRYKDVGCLDNNRVVLKIGSCSYIHANFVASPNNPRRFICTQRESKCAVYYPTKEDEFLTFQGGVSVKFRDREELSFPFNTKTKVEVTYLEVTIMGHAPQMCKHYHWIDWPDRGVPEADLAPLYLLYQVRSVRTPIVIHCSAGIGRTGTMVLIENAMEILERGEQLEKMDGYLQQLRAQRNNCIQTDQQYLFVHQVLLNFLREAGWVPQRLNSRLKDFTEHYLRLTRKP